ncbi:MAG: zinc transporter ZupT [Kiritimatiellae bacterium]|nr:zinc transporter ZupT [Kiritimatiellia bacterium]
MGGVSSMSSVGLALGLTLLAGMATGIGSCIAFFAGRTNYRFLSVATGFSAGVMLYVSFVEIFQKGVGALVRVYGEPLGEWANAGAFFGGILLIGVIDRLIPASRNPHETRSEVETSPLHSHKALLQGNESMALNSTVGPASVAGMEHFRLIRMGVLMALAIGIHNFPEGLVTFLAALDDPRLGMAIAIAIALHNIPEGISVAVPIFYASGSRRKAFIFSLLSGLAEPIGALVAYLLVLAVAGKGTRVPSQLTGLLFGCVAGIMVYISLDELLPTSREYGKGHDSILGLLSGMVIMALSLLLMK